MIIGIDGGGTKTEGVLVDQKGNIQKYLLEEGTNPNSKGFGRAAKTLCNMLDAFQSEGDKVEALCLSVAGIAMEDIQKNLKKVIEPHLSETTKIRMGSDALGCMSSGIKNEDGIVIIAGTGSAAFARVDGKYSRVGGWGQLIDDAGSGYDIGRLGLRAVLRAYDGRGEATSLTDLFIEKMNGKEPWNALGEIYSGGKEYIATFAPVVLNTKDDSVAEHIIERSVFDLTEMIKAAKKHLHPMDIIPIVLTGSIWKSSRIYSGVKEKLGETYQLIIPRLKPVYGAAVEAAIDAGWYVDEAFENAFADSYEQNAG